MILFIDMNSFFASCEQQVNYWLRGRPVGVCVYTGQFGCIIAPSIEAKLLGVKTGMRLNEAIKICPDLVPIEINSQRYRDQHKTIMNILRRYSQDVIPKSIDEAIVDLTNYRLIYKDMEALSRAIKADIKREAGDWMRCSVGIAPNVFLAKLASGLQKPDGYTVIDRENIDEVLARLKLTDLPGISYRNAERLVRGGITTPLQMRHTNPDKLRQIFRGIVGVYFHYRLNFKEVDTLDHPYRNMSAMRHISKDQRQSRQTLQEIFDMLCMTLERRMVHQAFCCNHIQVFFSYESGKSWKENIRTGKPLQDGIAIKTLIEQRIHKFVELKQCDYLLNENITSMGIVVGEFISDDITQYELIGDEMRQRKLRKTTYQIKDKFGDDLIGKAISLGSLTTKKDIIGFGSVKDMYDEEYNLLE